MLKDRKTLLFLLGNFYSFFLTGALVLMLGAVMPYLLKDYQLSYDQGGTLLMLQAAGNLTAAVLGGIISSYTGRRSVLIFGTLTYVIGYGGIAFIPSTALLYIFLIISGFGWGIINNLVNVIVSERTKGHAGILNVLHMFFAVGAVSGPFLVSLVISLGLGWKTAMGIMAVLSLLLAYVFLRMDMPGPTEESDMTDGSISGPKSRISLSFLRDIRFYVFMLLLFSYVGSENSVNGWLTTYLLDTGIADELFAQRILSLTWLAVIAGRLSSAWLSRHLSKEILLLAGGAASLFFFILLTLAGSPAMVFISVIGLGLSFAGIYPNTVANADYLIQGSGTAGGLMFSWGALGASLVPYIIGYRAEAGGIASGMRTLFIPLLFLVILCLVNLLLSKRRVFFNTELSSIQK
ncbi:MAG: MFS transporter [Caldicoprobacterales bacterium]|nr:MFS transporter [Clostridiales bacterium]